LKRYHCRCLIISIICFALGALVLFGIIGCTMARAADWLTIETRRATLYYQSAQDYEKYRKKIVATNYVFSEVLTILGVSLADLREMGKIKIYIHPDKKSLHATYYRIFKKPCPYRAWYTHKLKSIYVNIKDFRRGMLAHEMGHAVVDHYFVIRPTKAMREALAKYVERKMRQKDSL